MKYNPEWDDDPYIRGEKSSDPSMVVVGVFMILMLIAFGFAIYQRQAKLDHKQKEVEKLCDCKC